MVPVLHRILAAAAGRHDAVVATEWPLLLQGTASLDVPTAVTFPGLMSSPGSWACAPGHNPLGLVFRNGVRVVLGS